MSAAELEIKKRELVKDILNQSSEEIIDQLSRFYEKVKMDNYFPCQYSIEEVQQSANEVREDLINENYEKFTPHEEIKRKPV